MSVSPPSVSPPSGSAVITKPSPVARRARGAVAALFFVNGAVFANVVPRYPELKAGLALSNTAFGSAVAAYGFGALLLGLAAGWLVTRWGSARIAPASTILLSLNLVLLGVAPSWWALALALFLAGSGDSVADIAVNAHGLRVERLYRRSILNAFHGVWSVGAVVGGAMGATAAGLEIPLLWHLSVAGVVFAGVAVLLSRLLLRGPDDTERAPAGSQPSGPRRWPLIAKIAALGLIAGSAQLIEEVGATWSAVYLREDLGTAAAVAGLGFITLQAAQTVGRLLGDRLVTRYGDRTVARGGATMACLAMVAALAVPSPVLTIIGFGLAGLGIGTLIPASMRTVDEIPGLPPGVGLTLVGTVIRVGLFMAPPVVGLIADNASLRAGLILVPAAAALVVVLSPALLVRRVPSHATHP
ncbi:MAG TPA: MFS transporter [Micromonosporaceae bacterium]|nr:MFS transporter [Micromonosporaceae bacterium]